MLLAGRGLNRRYDLTRNTEFGERSKTRELIGFEIADGFVEPDHSFLDDIFAIGADEKITLGFDADEILVLVEQEFHRQVITRLGG